MEEDHLDGAMMFLNSTNSTPEDAQVYHNKRQNEFLRKCAVHMKDHERKWVSFHDVDEYYVINDNVVKDSIARAGRRIQASNRGARIPRAHVRHVENCGDPKLSRIVCDDIRCC